jgi:glutathione S-transferase
MAIFSLTWIFAALALPSWSSLESKLPVAPLPVYKESLPDSNNIAREKPVLYRDEDAMCPHSQQVWLALEAKNVDYATVLVPTSEDSSPLKVTWPDGTEQTDSLEILERIQAEYPENEPNLYPKRISECVDSVRCNIVRFKGVFPRRTKANIYAPFLFLEQGGLVSSSNHMVTLEETDEVLEEYYQGPFLCGKVFTAADIVWAPFLERYAVQLPCLLPGKPELDPRGGGEYPALREWYEAMESKVPCYSCRVQGDISQWKRALELGVQQYNNQENNDDNVIWSDNVTPVFPPHEIDGQALWNQYKINRPWLANTPEEECVAYIVRNRSNIMREATEELAMSANDADTALRQVIQVLLDKNDNTNTLSGNARDIALFVKDGIVVPRDLGMIPVMTLERIVKAAPAPRIA